VRAALDEIVRHYSLDVGGELAELERSLRADDVTRRTRNGALPVRTAQRALQIIAELDIRPDRGRPKDLARLRRLVRELREIWPE